MPLPIIRSIESRQTFLKILETNPGLIFIKFGAEWCAPCKKIEEDLETHFQNMPDNVQCIIVDVDECFDIYAYMKSKKMVKTIPAILCYQKGTTTYVPDDLYCGSDKNELDAFLARCKDDLL